MIPDLQEIFKNSFVNKEGKYTNSISEKDVQLLFEHKLFKCFLSKELNGLELSIQKTLTVIEEASFVNGSLGWLVQIGNGGNYFASNFEREVSIDLFSKENAVIAGSGAPMSNCKKVEGGVLVSGKWRFCSGSQYATLFTLTFKDETSGEICSGIVERKDVKIIHDWKTIGLKNTSTNSIEVSELFIPDKHLFSVYNQKAFLEEEVFNLPFIIYAQSFFIHVVFGIFKRMLVETKKIIQDVSLINSESQIKRNKKLKLLHEKGEVMLSAAKSTIDKNINFVVTEKEIGEIRNNEIQGEFIYHVNELRNHALQIFIQHGIEAVYEEHVIAILFNDLLTVCQHKLMNEIVE